MCGDIIENRSQGPDAYDTMPRNGDVVFARRRKREAHVTAGLTRHDVADASEPAHEVISRNVARQSQTAITSSRVK